MDAAAWQPYLVPSFHYFCGRARIPQGTKELLLEVPDVPGPLMRENPEELPHSSHGLMGRGPSHSWPPTTLFCPGLRVHYSTLLLALLPHHSESCKYPHTGSSWEASGNSKLHCHPPSHLQVGCGDCPVGFTSTGDSAGLTVLAGPISIFHSQNQQPWTLPRWSGK